MWQTNGRCAGRDRRRLEPSHVPSVRSWSGLRAGDLFASVREERGGRPRGVGGSFRSGRVDGSRCSSRSSLGVSALHRRAGSSPVGATRFVTHEESSWASFACIADRPDPFRPSWRIRTPTGSALTVEFDRLRHLWRVSPGDYIRRQLPGALGQATVQSRDADWIRRVEQELMGAESAQQAPAHETKPE